MTSDYIRGLEAAAQKAWDIGHDWAIAGDGAKADAAEYVVKSIRALAPPEATAPCLKCGHGKVIDGICQQFDSKARTICGCACESPPATTQVSNRQFLGHPWREACTPAALDQRPANPDFYSPDARHCAVCTERLGRAMWHLPPLCAPPPSTGVADECAECGGIGSYEVAVTGHPVWRQCPECKGTGTATAQRPADDGTTFPETEEDGGLGRRAR